MGKGAKLMRRYWRTSVYSAAWFGSTALFLAPRLHW